MACPETTAKAANGRIAVQRDDQFDFQRRTISERTSLLAAVNDISYSHGTDSSLNKTFVGCELADQEIDPNDFNQMLSRSAPAPAGLGIEPRSQDPPILRGSRRFNKVGTRRLSSASGRRKLIDGYDCVDESMIEDEEYSIDNPYIGGVSVRAFWLIYAGILANLFISCFDTTILASSHPVITSYFHSSNSASWLSTAFVLTSTAFQPLFGRISDTMGRKPPYVFSMVIFLIATVWCALSRSMTEFILARALCGLGAGGTMVMGSIITSDLVPIEIRGAYQSYINIVFGAGSVLGAATGGAIADTLGWRWEFGFQVPFLVVCLLSALLAIPKSLGLKEGIANESLVTAMKKFDYQGSVLLTTSITGLILGLNLGGNVFEWTHPIVIFSLVLFSVCFPLFLYCESRVALPIMPLQIITHSPRANIIFSNFLASIVIHAVYFNVPLYFQAVLLESATSSGLRLMVPSMCATIGGVATGFLISWSKRLKWPLVSGAILMFIGTFALCTIQIGMPTWLYLLLLVPYSTGQGFIFPGAFIALLNLSEQAEQAVVTSTMTLWRSLGMVLGVATSGFVVQNALVIYLNRFVTGPDKAEVVIEVRQSIKAIATLPLQTRNQVIDAYAASIRVTFISITILAFFGMLLVLWIRIPRLGKKA